MRALLVLILCLLPGVACADYRALAAQHFAEDMQQLEAARLALEHDADRVDALCERRHHDLGLPRVPPQLRAPGYPNDACDEERHRLEKAERALANDIADALEVARRCGVYSGVRRDGLTPGLDALRRKYE